MRGIQVTSVLNRQKRRDSWFLTEYSVNPYSGCTIDCAYCYVLGSKYGLNTAEQFSVKTNAVEVLDRQLARRAKRGEFGYIALASATDPYVQVEARLGLTRKMLEVILRHRFPVTVATKSTLVRRDADLLKQIDAAATLPTDLRQTPGRGTIVMVSISTLDESVAWVLEPGAASPAERLETVRRCSEAGLLAGVAFMPLLPSLSDSDAHLDQMVRAAVENRAQFAFFSGLTLFGNTAIDSKMRYLKFVAEHYPALENETALMYQDSSFPPGSYERTLERKAKNLCSKHGLRYGLH